MFSCFRQNAVAPEGKCCQQLRVRCSQLEINLLEEKLQHAETKLIHERAVHAHESKIRDMDGRILSLTRQSVNLEYRLDQSNTLLKQAQQNLLESTRQLDAARRQMMREAALLVEGSSSRLAKRLEEILVDPVSYEMIKDPVIMPSGNTVGRQGLLTMQSLGMIFDPLTRISLARNEPLYDNLLIAQVVRALEEFNERGAAARLVLNLDELLVDPESLGLVERPVVLPSGSTVSAQKLGTNDRRIVYKNLLVENVLDAYKEFLASSGA